VVFNLICCLKSRLFGLFWVRLGGREMPKGTHIEVGRHTTKEIQMGLKEEGNVQGKPASARSSGIHSCGFQDTVRKPHGARCSGMYLSSQLHVRWRWGGSPFKASGANSKTLISITKLGVEVSVYHPNYMGGPRKGNCGPSWPVQELRSYFKK
jgi:hypothetical protein